MDKEEAEIGKEEEENMAISTINESQIKLPPMTRMKQMAQEAMQKKGLTEKDIRKLIGIKRYEKED
ncbi:hypothetical protein [Desulfosporosinus sp. BICA1-9]|uniref:hypothetical protein n=1 Tax=Desulfosporosinus sp. BICA1-9 TaxID=1531958 RepID=UPI00054B20BA|nr:hypothetical protein [Desulfosporosinus sp. BICA1-9]KJS90112.1 MAG: hypothetical protein JL57_03430 [Desulfosporosinus sp. BICA1-9]